jgi:hypothetical protein
MNAVPVDGERAVFAAQSGCRGRWQGFSALNGAATFLNPERRVAPDQPSAGGARREQTTSQAPSYAIVPLRAG